MVSYSRKPFDFLMVSYAWLLNPRANRWKSSLPRETN
jgi:hypothetical protein